MSVNFDSRYLLAWLRDIPVASATRTRTFEYSRGASSARFAAIDSYDGNVRKWFGMAGGPTNQTLFPVGISIQSQST
jgi:hypothetical protein